MNLRIAMSAALLSLSSTAARADEPGQSYYLLLSHQEKSEDTTGNTSSSSGRDDRVERIIEVSDLGLIVEFDLPAEKGGERKPIDWQFPARMLINPDGTMTLLNEAELAARNAEWRRLAGIEESACGQWYFTWNAFKIECDPQSVVANLEIYSLRYGMPAEGLELAFANTLSPARLRDCSDEGGAVTLCADYLLDPEKIRESRIENDKIVASMLGKDTRSGAASDRVSEQIEGTLELRLYLNDQGHVWKRIVSSTIKTTLASGEVETSTTREELTRSLVSRD